MNDESLTVDVQTMGSAFMKANDYLSTIPKKYKQDSQSAQESLNFACQKWMEHFGIKVNAVWGTDILTFTFKSKSEYVLFMLEWS